jgi:site-specific DNA recombinase
VPTSNSCRLSKVTKRASSLVSVRINKLLSEDHGEYKGLAKYRWRPDQMRHAVECFENQFYIGLLQVQNAGPIYSDILQKLISRELFLEAFRVLGLKLRKRIAIQRHLFSVTFKCLKCKRYLIAERHKGHMYYRCHTKGCLRSEFREELIRRVLSEHMITLGRDDDSSIMELGDFLKIRDIISNL